MGATATGKSALAMTLAGTLGGEIVSMDSRQVYRGFDVGTAKPPAGDLRRIPHHLVDVAEPAESWSAGRHSALAERALREIAAREKVPVLVGGTGLYFRALFHGLVNVAIPPDDLARIRATFVGRHTDELHSRLALEDPPRARQLSPNDRVRITRALEIIAHTGITPTAWYARQHSASSDIAYLKLVLFLPRAQSRERIAERTRALFKSGWPVEVARLVSDGVARTAPAMNSLGYRALADAIERGEDPTDCLDAVIQETRRYAKRQETFFRGERDAVWIDISEDRWNQDVEGRVTSFLGLTEVQ